MLLTALVLQIPVLMVRGLVYDRKDLSNEVKAELVSSWGGMMEITTPQLRVSYVAEANGKKETLDSQVEELIEKRTAARKAKDFKTADEIRDKLKEMGIVLEDTPQGVKWTRA